MVILGTQYAGEMKKGIFTVMHYLMPKIGILSLHSGCNEGKGGDVTLFFGLSGKSLPQSPHHDRDWAWGGSASPLSHSLGCVGAKIATRGPHAL